MEMESATLLLLLMMMMMALLGWGLRGRGGPDGLPPGPLPLPLLGNLLQLDPTRLYQSLIKLGNQFGPVFTVYLGPRPCVVLNGYEAVRDALVLQGDQFSGRGDLPVFNRFTRGNGIAFSNGEKWRVLRSFALMSLKNFGLGQRSIEARIQEEASCLGQELAKTDGAPFDPQDLICNAVSNIICAVVFGQRYGYDDSDFLTLLGLFNDNFRLMSSRCGELYNIFPDLMDLLPGPHRRIFSNFEKLRVFISERVRQHRETRQPGQPRDFIDCFLDQMDKEKEDPLTNFHSETLVMTTHNLFFGGTETTSTTLRYTLLILLKYPDVAERVYAEIDEVMGRSGAPCLAHRVRMPYTNAVLHEAQRFITVLPTGLPRAVTQDTRFRGYLLPKGTNVIPLLVSVHRDPTQFKDPDAFNPENFLDEKGAFRNSDAFMPFAPASCNAFACAPWSPPTPSTSPRGTRGWATCPHPTSCACWPAEPLARATLSLLPPLTRQIQH
ncbi:cytochrome P450 2F2-like isoform X2 [Tachyglossus aculeatus]|uniref:cytochrome P450 2F2-like isoform X2 n=1 Tax=Tachyglossus aculeatus TaxID=9261 RepID=UPI0018F71CA4|nr:cytochrome P450 2F2-like isoform X2 [Tachyglossus aculeatus]